MAEPDLSELIESRAAEPGAASGDGQSTTDRSLSELIEADRYLAAKAAAKAAGGTGSGWKLTRPARGLPPGAV